MPSYESSLFDLICEMFLLFGEGFEITVDPEPWALSRTMFASVSVSGTKFTHSFAYSNIEFHGAAEFVYYRIAKRIEELRDVVLEEHPDVMLRNRTA